MNTNPGESVDNAAPSAPASASVPVPVSAPPPGSVPTQSENTIVVLIKQLDGSSFSISIAPTATIRELKLAIQRERGLEMERQRLIYRAQELKNDGNALIDYGIVNNSTLHIVIRPLGVVGPSASGVAANEGDIVIIGPGANPNSPRDAVININQLGAYRDPSYISNEEHIHQQPQYQYPYHPDGGDVLHIVKLSRFIRIFAVMDFIFLVLFGLTVSPLFFIMAGLALAGYYGAKILKRGYLIAYMLCLVLEIAGRAYFLYLDSTNTLSIVLFILMICIELFVLRCIVLLYKAIGRLDAPLRERALALNRSVF